MNKEPLVLADIEDARSACHDARARGLKVAFIPTMGALHDGHLALVRTAQALADFTVLSIFVNPTQFSPGEDFDSYPRNLPGDLKKLSEVGVDFVFAPTKMAIFPQTHKTVVCVEELSKGLCGEFRPGHFAGVATVVTKLFNIIGPCQAIFGRKDYQQLKIITRMVADLNMPIEVVGVPTIREADGLALSSRNAYLSGEERTRALSLSRGLSAAHLLFKRGERSVGRLRGEVKKHVEASADTVDYIAAADPDSLQSLQDNASIHSRTLLAIAAFVGRTRLIDNTVLGEDEPPIAAF